MSRVGWVDCSSGVSGDMLLGALVDLGALDGLPGALDSLADLGVDVTFNDVQRGGLRAVAVSVAATADQPHRHLRDVQALIGQTAVPAEVQRRAGAVFERLALAEARSHGTTPEQVEFHEVGAVDSIVDVIGGCLGLHSLGLDALVVSEVSLGGGAAHSGHGEVPVPTPAALELLKNCSLLARAGGEVELATPTGLALLAEWATGSGAMPAMQVDAIGTGAGSRDLADHPNVLRLVVGAAAAPAPVTAGPDDGWVTVEANVDDLDPRLWPGVLQRLIDAGAADAWLTPILMKKGRPAHLVGALVPTSRIDAVHGVLFTETSTIGARTTAVTKRALDRTWLPVDIDGQTVRVKLASCNGQVLTATPEFEDVVAAAQTLGVPTKEVLARAGALAQSRLSDPALGVRSCDR
jgi:uncharacterized protein (TIGR00299 family) protein